MSNPIERVTPNDRRLPPNLLLSEPVDAEILPDGRAVPITLPPAAIAFHYPDLPIAEGVVVPSFDEPEEPLAADTPLTVMITGTNASGEAVTETVPILPLPDVVAEPNPSTTVLGNLTPSPNPEPASDSQPTPSPAATEDTQPASEE